MARALGPALSAFLGALVGSWNILDSNWHSIGCQLHKLPAGPCQASHVHTHEHVTFMANAGLLLGFLYVVFLLGWEGVWNRGPRMGKDQGLLLVASHGGVLEGHLQAPGHGRHAMGAMVWRWQIL